MKKINYLRISSVWAILFMLMICAAALSARPESAARKKARYYYSAAQVCEAEGRSSDAHEYFRLAHISDPSYEEAASALGISLLSLDNGDLQSPEFQQFAFNMMSPYMKKYPEDVNEAIYYAYVAEVLGHTEEAADVLENIWKFNPNYTAALIQLSELYLRAGDIPKSVEALTRYETQEGMSQHITMLKMSYLMADGDTIGAAREVDRLLASDPTGVEPLILKGSFAELLEKPDSALIYYQLAAAMDPDASAPKLALAGYYSAKGDSASFDTMMCDVIEAEDLDIDTKLDIVSGFLQSQINEGHESARGDRLFGLLQKQAPHDSRVLDLAARYCAAKHDFPEAVANISYAIDQDPANETFWAQLMMYYAAQDSLESAMHTFERASQHFTPNESFTLQYASVAQSAKRYDLAESAYKQLITSICPTENIDTLQQLSSLPRSISLKQLDMLSVLYAMLGDVYNLEKKEQLSYQAYENAILFDPDNQMAYNNYAYFTAINGGDLDKALALSEKAIKDDGGKNSTYLDTYAWILFLKGNTDNALTYQLKAVETMENDNSPSAEVYIHLGDIYAKLQQWPEALDYWQKGIKTLEETSATDEPEYQDTLKKIADAPKQ